MTVRLVAVVTCDRCGVTNTVDDSNVRARNAGLVARGEGWRIVGDGADLCPWCVDLIDHPEKQLALL